MDNKTEEENVKFIKSEISTCSTPTPPRKTAPTSTSSTPTTTSSETSIDSVDILSSWTLVNNNNKKDEKFSKDTHDEHVEILKTNDNEEKEDVAASDSDLVKNDNDLDEKLHDEHTDEDLDRDAGLCFEDSDVYLEDSLHKYSYDDDVSDGISFVDSDFNKKDEVREFAPKFPAFVQTQEPYTCRDLLKYAATSVLQLSYCVTKRGLSCILYVGIGIALLGFLGNMLKTSWQPLPAIVNTFAPRDQLQQRINELELQNNLMLAEIDLLNKQMKHLTTVYDAQQPSSAKYKDRKSGKTFKAWPGNGDKPVEINKEDLKKPYKCSDGSFVEIANMCLEVQSPQDPSIVDQFGEVLENLKAESEVFKTFEQVADELHGSTDNPPEESNQYASHIHHKKEDKNNHNQYKKDSSRECKKCKAGRRGSSEIYSDDGGAVEWQEKRMKGREQLRNKIDSHEDDDDDDDDDSREWHGNYMKHREQQRKKNVYKSDSHEWHGDQPRKQYAEHKNQYKKYGHSHEHKHSGENQYR